MVMYVSVPTNALFVASSSASPLAILALFTQLLQCKRASTPRAGIVAVH
jgi:hypothetical protein